MTSSDSTRHDLDQQPVDIDRRTGELHLVPAADTETIAEPRAAAAGTETIAKLRADAADWERAYKDLEGAIASARRIGAAIGIVMSIMKVTEADAFAMLARISQRQNRKLRLVADDIVLTGDF